jgi:hypothetical protein|tara:strand:- start:2546 stop:2713 length:168 start_codon:yes stop_codon:yes gene_type:complete
MATKTDKKKQELTDDILKELQALADKLSGVFSLGKDTYKIKRRDNVKRTRSSKKS